MSQRAEELATQFQQVHDQLVAAIQPMSPQQWAAATHEEGWTAGAAAHHAVIAAEPLSGFVRAAATGEPLPPITPEQLNEINRQHAEAFANVSKDEVIAEVNKNVPPTAALLRSLTDEELDKQAETPFGGPMTTEQIIRNVLIGHVQQHLASVQGAG